MPALRPAGTVKINLTWRLNSLFNNNSKVTYGASGNFDSFQDSAPSNVLSTLHKRPQENKSTGYTAEITINGGLITVKKPPKNDKKPVGGVRGGISKFSRASRRGLMRKMAGVDRKKAGLPLFITLTYAKIYPENLKDSKRDLKIFFQRMIRSFPDACGIWKLEPQKRGAPHYHLLVWGADYQDLLGWVPKNWYEIAGFGDENHLKFHQGFLGGKNRHCVSQIRSWRGVRSYTSKYMGKLVDSAGWASPGRFWGVFHRSALDMSPVAIADLTRAEAVNYMRLMRRYAHLKGRDYTSLTILIENPEKWQALLC